MREPGTGIGRLFGGLSAMLRPVPVIMEILKRRRHNHGGKTDQTWSAFPMKRLTWI